MVQRSRKCICEMLLLLLTVDMSPRGEGKWRVGVAIGQMKNDVDVNAIVVDCC